MFTGIIETIGIVKNITPNGSNKTFLIESSISHQLRVDQSLSHNGVCLTVETVSGHTHIVTAIEETLKKTNLGQLSENNPVNLERCLSMNGRLNGHLVQGHVDDAAECVSITDQNGSWEYQFQFNEKFAALIIEKGSVCINGVSLTVYDVTSNTFKVAIIPYTYHHTNLSILKVGHRVNIEFDVIGKYILRSQQLDNSPI